MRVVIVGGGFENHGAAAMVRTVQNELGKRLDGADLYLHVGADGPKEAVWSAGLTPAAGPTFRSRLGKALWTARHSSIGELAGVRSSRDLHAAQKAASARETFRLLAPVDAVIDVSGFAYGDDWGRHQLAERLTLARLCRDSGGRVVFMPQAWGPFNSSWLKDQLQHLFSGPGTLAFARDARSLSSLSDIGADQKSNSGTWPDIAFLFEGAGENRGRQLLAEMGCSATRPIVGIAPNSKVLERATGEGACNAYIRMLARLAAHCIDVLGADVVLQANDIALDDRRDDRYLCALVRTQVSRPDRCFMLRRRLHAEESKALIGEFDLLLASRFHSLVFGLSQGVPAVAVGWSHKYGELMSDFGLGDLTVSWADATDEVVTALVDKAWQSRQEKRPQIIDRAQAARARSSELFDLVAGALSSQLP